MKKKNKKLIDRIFMTIPVLMHKMFHDLKLPENEYNLNKTHFKTLLVIHLRQNPNITKVCRNMNMRKGSMTTVVDRLIELKLLVRKVNPDDRREVYLLLTSDGKKLVNRYLTVSQKHAVSKLAVLSEQEMEKMDSAINSLYEITQKL